ncbi:MAG TPA: hypothetical protein VFL73_10520 [Solirubrobacteraceae bacterium]|nr:hypothetical protein [Solirubrobacteraceae bacterium]
MTSDGSAYSRFRRALLTGNMSLVNATARELPQIALDDALRILRVMAAKQDPRFDRAAARFAARAIHELGLGLAEARYVLALVEALAASPDTIGELLRHVVAGAASTSQPAAGATSRTIVSSKRTL